LGTELTNFQLRSARQADAKTIRRIVRRAQISPLNLDWRRFLVAEIGGEVVGIGQVRDHSHGIRELASIAVEPDWRGRGIASLIIMELVGREVGDVYLLCQDTLESFYGRFGFQRQDTWQHPPKLGRYVRLGNIFFNLSEKIGRDRIRIIVMRRKYGIGHE
jgi:N-acetylglutamate synthase-like GNAT family acetyltransferase